MKTIEEKNRLIAEFMGYETQDGSSVLSIPRVDYFIEDIGWVREDNLKFHTSWDWLMPVVKKVSKFTDEQVIMNVDYKHNRSECLMYYGGRFHPHISSEELIDNTYNAVVQFIEWYNENK